jgi:hypothetical protein
MKVKADIEGKVLGIRLFIYMGGVINCNLSSIFEYTIKP